jgi:hypothetical protein
MKLSRRQLLHLAAGPGAGRTTPSVLPASSTKSPARISPTLMPEVSASWSATDNCRTRGRSRSSRPITAFRSVHGRRPWTISSLPIPVTTATADRFQSSRCGCTPSFEGLSNATPQAPARTRKASPLPQDRFRRTAIARRSAAGGHPVAREQWPRKATTSGWRRSRPSCRPGRALVSVAAASGSRIYACDRLCPVYRRISTRTGVEVLEA